MVTELNSINAVFSVLTLYFDLCMAFSIVENRNKDN